MFPLKNLARKGLTPTDRNKMAAVLQRLFHFLYGNYHIWSHGSIITNRPRWFNTLTPRENRRHVAEDIFKCIFLNENEFHYSDVKMSGMASQITRVGSICPIVCEGAYQRIQSSASLAFVRGIHRWPVDSSQRGPVTRFHLMTSSCIWNGVG